MRPLLSDRPRPLIIAHRGASGERPEHSRAAYDLAIAQGADLLEPDLVISRDGMLVVRHENELSGTTDIAARPEFAARRTAKRIDGRPVEGWFAEDLTLEELKSLRCRERLPELRPANTAFDGRDPILTLDELIAIARAGKVGLVIELKHAAFFAGIGLPLEPPLGAALAGAGDLPAWLESFEPGALARMAGLTATPRVQLIDGRGAPADAPDTPYADMLTDAGLDRLAEAVQGISVEKALLTPDLTARAHARGLKVFAWTYRAENAFLPPAFQGPGGEAEHGDLASEIRGAASAGADGLFCDFPAIAAAALR